MTKDFSIVGIGASAGGLNAITEFFTHMPNDTGLAFVVVQHLSPDFKSLMDELLAKHTAMPIKVIDKDTEVEENSIYLIPAKFNIMIEDGVIKNVDRQSTSALNLPIDIFFHSLGEDLKEKSIGIILSGTGTDGSRGIRSIKEEGGLIFVQDPNTAQFDGMPNAALATHLVDAVISPADIASKVASIAQKTENGKKALLNVQEMTDLELFKRILELVEKESKINFLDYRQNTLIRRLEKRMYLNQTENVNEYYNILVKSKEEVRALFNEFLIGVTRFFRDKEAFEILNKTVIPNFFKEEDRHHTLRIWCVGCSTGEEAYTTAILLTEYMENQGINKKYKIFATDVDQNAIKKASQGVYPESIISDVGNDFLERYFIIGSSGYKIKKNIRDNLVFTVHDSLNDPPFINIDLLICRNMMIYLKPDVQKKLLFNFRFALRHQSYLFLGPSESISSVKDAFKPLNTRWNIFQLISKEKPVTISRARKIELPPLQAEHWTFKHLSRHREHTEPYQSYKPTEDFIAQAISQRYGPRSLFVDEKLNIVYINGDFKDILLFPKNFTDLNLLSRLQPEEHLLFRNGVRQALGEKEARTYKKVQFERDQKSVEVDVQFSVFNDRALELPLIWIAFRSLDGDLEGQDSKGQQVIDFNDYKNEKLNSLEYELSQVKKEKQFLVEQLEAANEELQSSNEELLAANEELQSTNEELQSVNEELYTVNTELQSKINELITSNNDISNLLESTNIGIIFLDKTLRIRKFTPALKDQFDLEESDIGRPISNFTNSFSLNMNEEMKTLFENEQILAREVEDQKGNTFLMRMLPYWTSERKVDGAVISFINLNELKDARRAIDENAGKYEAIFNHVTDVIITLDTEGTIMSLNSGFRTGLEPEQLIGMKFYDIITDEAVDSRKEAFEELLRTRKPVSYEFNYTDPQNEPRWFDVHLVPIIQEGVVKSAILIAHDVTLYKIKEGKLLDQSADLEKELFHRNQELEDANLELQEVNSYLDSFVHGAAHDLRAPLAQMKGMVRLLPKITEKKQADMVLEQFKKGVENMDNTLSGLIELIEFQKNTAEMISPINLVEAYQRTEEQLSAEIEETQATIITDFQFEGEINYIPAYIQSVFYNLLTNALKYRREEEPLQIDLAIRKEEVDYLIEVKDNGMGMDLNRYGHLLFKPFKRLTIDRSGMGIGLSIINSAIKKTGGRIEVKSQLGKGTTFTVYLADMGDNEN